MPRFLYFSIYTSIISLLLMTSCDSLRKEVDPSRLNREAAKLVVTCFLSPQDTVLAVKINRSQPVLGNDVGYIYNGNTVTNATVTLSEGNRSILLPYAARETYYKEDISKLPILAGHTYTLTVQTPGGEQVTSACTIPEPVNLARVAFDSVESSSSGGRYVYTQYFVRGHWQDPAGQANYYQLTGSFRAIFLCKSCESNPNYKEQEQVTTPYFDNNGNTSLLTDRGFEGKEMVSDRAYYASFQKINQAVNGPVSSLNSQYKSATLFVNLLSTDQAYYQYRDAIGRQTGAGDNPFAEPVPVPSNIQGGLGCFAGYNRSTMVIKLK